MRWTWRLVTGLVGRNPRNPHHRPSTVEVIEECWQAYHAERVLEALTEGPKLGFPARDGIASVMIVHSREGDHDAAVFQQGTIDSDVSYQGAGEGLQTVDDSSQDPKDVALISCEHTSTGPRFLQAQVAP